MHIQDLQGVIFDLDGTIYLGDQLLPGAFEACSELVRCGKRLTFVSNKPLGNRQSYAAKLNQLGINASPEQVITSACVLGAHLAAHHPELRYYVIGEENLRDELRSYGLFISDDLIDQDEFQVIDAGSIQAVVVAFDRTLNYRKLNIAYQALMHGAHFFATNIDLACPMPGGAIPDAGATIAALEKASGRKLELAAGKPSPLIINTAITTMGLPAERCLMVGDRLETDIRMGLEAGMATALVFTGVSQRAHLAGQPYQPDLLLDDLSELIEAIQ